jgi:hypothetical protein
MGRAKAITRTDISARELRFIAKRTRDCRVVRRILPIARCGRSLTRNSQTSLRWAGTGARRSATGVKLCNAVA